MTVTLTVLVTVVAVSVRVDICLQVPGLAQWRHDICPWVVQQAQSYCETDNMVAADGAAIEAVRENGIVSMKGVMGGNNAAVKEIKPTDYEPGTLGHLTKFPMQYSFSDRMAAMNRVNAGEPLATKTEYVPGSAGCCATMCIIS